MLQVTRVPVWLLKSTRNILKSFQWARDAADRLVRLCLLLVMCFLMVDFMVAGDK